MIQGVRSQSVSLLLVLVGAILFFAAAIAVWMTFNRHLEISSAGFRSAIYDNVERLSVVLILAVVGAVWSGDRLFHGDVKYVNHIPWGARWWEYVLTGLVAVPLASLFSALFLGALATVGVVLPYKLVAEYILVAAPTLTKVIVAIPMVVLATGVLITFAIVVIINEGRGTLSGDEGKLLTHRNQGGSGGGPQDLLKVYYFSCLALLGAGFGEYKPTGYCRVVTLMAVLCGRVLEVVVIGISANVLAGSFGR